MAASGDGRPLVVAFAGTRPEAIKLAPVVRAARVHCGALVEVVLVATGQDPAVGDTTRGFGVHPVAELRPPGHGGELADLCGAMLPGVAKWIGLHTPAGVLVQGDTSSTMAAALAAFYAGLPVAHLEAGLRTRDVRRPFPEEMHRRALAVLASLHLAPTGDAADRLVDEGHDRRSIVITGNTVVDAFELAAARHVEYPSPELERIDASGRPLVIVTVHRRESWAERVSRVADAVSALAATHPDVWFVCSLHPNPVVAASFRRLLADIGNVVCLSPVPYAPFARLLSRASVVLTDSGGIQAEAPSLGVRVVVLRDETERPESVRCGVAELVGTDPDRIRSATTRALHASLRWGPVRVANPHGDGRAGKRVVDALAWHLNLCDRPADFVPSG
jgi:UDP-N-acetylglucosamine 2-epimerase (non-hydrolysing)